MSDSLLRKDFFPQTTWKKCRNIGKLRN